MIQKAEYEKLSRMLKAFVEAKKKFDPKRAKGMGGYTPREHAIISLIAGTRKPTNHELAKMEDYEWHKDPPRKYFAYYDKGMKSITGWMGNVLGKITWMGKPYRVGNYSRKVALLAQGSNGVFYKGLAELDSGTYVRLTRAGK
ncbi:MAG: hypothetical protein ACREI9_08955 [Nitrospiraceae bacterium]